MDKEYNDALREAIDAQNERERAAHYDPYADICRLKNYVDAKIFAPMDIQEQKALCRIVAALAEKCLH